MLKTTRGKHRKPRTRKLGWLAYGLAPLWLAAILAQFERRGDLTASVKSGSGEEGRTCALCGDTLTDVAWIFDPCPASEDGDHREA